MACPGCISEDIMMASGRFSKQRLLEIGQELFDAGVKAVVLIGGGEPLAHPGVGDLIQFLGAHDVHIGITTNGTFIKKHLEVIARYSKWTRVSMDAATAQTFNQLRPSKSGKSKFEFIVSNMEKLARAKQGKLGYSFLIQTPEDGAGIISNIHEIYAAAMLAKEIGCDYFQVKPSYQFRGGIDHALMVHDNSLMQQAREEILRLDDLVTDDFSVMKAINLDYSLDGQLADQYKSYTSCPMTELRTLICPSGSFVCPYWRGKEHMRIGDLNVESFAEMWSGDRRKKVMHQLNPGEDCNFHCLRHEPNLQVFEIMESIKNGESIDIIDEFDRFI
jgi:MoaA/NifB/PqqE/SkfB family radical SAM enzyme